MEWKCKECGCKVPPSFILWNEICVFCWWSVKKWKGRSKEEVIISEKERI